MTPLSRAKELARKVHDESHTLTSPAFYEAVMALQSAVLALPEPAPVRETHQHRFITDEDGCVWPCGCGAVYSSEPRS
jgi:hypothetical protein